MNNPTVLDDTVKRAVVPLAASRAVNAPIDAPLLEFPQLYIIAPAPEGYLPTEQEISELRREVESLDDDEYMPATVPLSQSSVAMYHLETASAYVFDAWVAAICSGGIVFDFAMVARLVCIDRSRWSLKEKWWMINALALSGLKLPLYSRAEALVALIDMEVAQ